MSDDDDEGDVPPPPKDWASEEPWADDPLAFFEEKKDPLDAQIEEQDKRNRLEFKRHFGRLSIWSMYGIWSVFVIVSLIWLFNNITPFTFLSPAQLDQLQSIAFSGMLGALASAWARRHIEN